MRLTSLSAGIALLLRLDGRRHAYETRAAGWVAPKYITTHAAALQEQAKTSVKGASSAINVLCF